MYQGTAANVDQDLRYQTLSRCLLGHLIASAVASAAVTGPTSRMAKPRQRASSSVLVQAPHLLLDGARLCAGNAEGDGTKKPGHLPVS